MSICSVVLTSEPTFPIFTSSECSKVVASCSHVGAMALQWPHQGAKNLIKWAPEAGRKERKGEHEKPCSICTPAFSEFIHLHKTNKARLKFIGPENERKKADFTANSTQPAVNGYTPLTAHMNQLSNVYCSPVAKMWRWGPINIVLKIPMSYPADFHLQTRNHLFFFLQNQNIQLQWSSRAVISARQLSWAAFIFAVVASKSRNVRRRETRVFTVGWLWLTLGYSGGEMSVM